MEEGNQTPIQQPESPVSDVQNTQSPQTPQPTTPPSTVSQPPIEPEKPKSNKILLFGVVLLLLAIIGVVTYLFYQNQNKQTPQPTSYEECVNAQGSVIQKSYPATCVTKDGERFVQPLSEEEQQNLQPPTTQVPTQQISDELTYEQDLTLDWKTYINEKYKFSFKYPETGSVKEVNEKYISYINSIVFEDLTYALSIFINDNPKKLSAKDYYLESIGDVDLILPHLNISEVVLGETSATLIVQDSEHFEQQSVAYTNYFITKDELIIQIVTPEYFGKYDGSKTNVEKYSLPEAQEISQILSTFQFLE